MTNNQELSVMVVDDEPGIRTALRANFLRHGWKVETASCVREALRSVESRDFDLVVTDIRMPDGTGMEVMRGVRNSSATTAVILLTAYGSVPDSVNAMRDGALDYLTKPISFDQLQATAAQLMRRAKQAPEEETAATGDIVGSAPLLLRAIQRARRGERGRGCLDRSRERNRQRAACTLHSRRERPEPEAIRCGQLRGPSRGAAGERIVWAWARRIYRRRWRKAR